jgi:ABC-type multidrug transport system fused ATPase/permease subunit
VEEDLFMPKKDSTWRSLTRLVRELPAKHLLALSVLATLGMVFTNIYFAHLIRALVDAAAAKSMPAFTSAIVDALLLAAVDTILKTVQVRTSGKYSELGSRSLRERMAAHTTAIPYSRLQSEHSGEYLSRLTNDLSRVQNFVNSTLIDAILRPLLAIGAFAYLCMLNWKLTLISTFGVPLILLGASALSAPISKNARALQERLADVAETAKDAISGVEVVRVFGLQNLLTIRHDKAISESLGSARRLSAARSTLSNLSFIIGFIPFLFCIGFGGYQVLEGGMTIGSLLAFVQLLNRLTWPVSMMPQLLAQARGDMASAARVFELLDEPTERSGGVAAVPLPGAPAIAFTDVSFAYPGKEEPVFNGLSLRILPGETVAIVGPSGSGKSTIIRLLLGLYEAKSGAVQLFGADVREWSLHDLRDRLALVSQDVYLFPGTIRENIAYGKPGATDAEITAAAEAANAHDFILEFARGYDTEVGELGGKLSGGQRQRIAIARAILKNAPVLLLDEATSALDTESEHLVQEALERFMKGRTCLIIAHRLSTIRNADRVLVLNQGRVVEEGRHDELLAQGGLYSALYTQEASVSDQREEAM